MIQTLLLLLVVIEKEKINESYTPGYRYGIYTWVSFMPCKLAINIINFLKNNFIVVHKRTAVTLILMVDVGRIL